MKANELMIRDLVFVPHNGSATHYGQVCGIYDGEVVSTTLEKYSGLTKASALNPIPLTPEILEKNGFKYQKIGFGTHYYIADDYYDIAIDEWSDSMWRFRYDCTEMSMPPTQALLCNVHELQHALRLCGLNELADNFKV